MDRKGYGFVTFADPKAAMKFLEVRMTCHGLAQQQQQETWAICSPSSALATGITSKAVHALEAMYPCIAATPPCLASRSQHSSECCQ